MRHLIFFLLIGFAGLATTQKATAQEVRGTTHYAIVRNGDTIPIIELRPVNISAPRIFKNRFEEYRYRRLVRNIKIVYPYARLAGIKFQEYNKQLMELESGSERRRAMRKAEEELRKQFEDDLRKLTFSQGLILIKLVDRETSHTSYEVLKDFRGMFTAVFWQSLGRLFGYNLKTEYDPEGEDQLIEEIVQMIESGAL